MNYEVGDIIEFVYSGRKHGGVIIAKQRSSYFVRLDSHDIYLKIHKRQILRKLKERGPNA